MVLLIIVALAVLWVAISRYRNRLMMASELASYYDIHETATIHFPSMTLANTSIGGLPFFFDLKREDSLTWLSKPSGLRSDDSEAEWEPFEQPLAARVESAYQLFLTRGVPHPEQTKEWFYEKVCAIVAVRDAEIIDKHFS